MDKFDEYIGRWLDRVIDYIPEFVVAIVYLILGMLIIKFFRRFMTRLMTKKQTDPTVLKFLMDLLTWIFRVLLVISVIGQLGVPTTSFVAVIGAAGLAVGLSLQGSLSNFAGGILIILFKPFRVGEYIEAQGQAGTIAAIQIFSTEMITTSNQVVYIPNGALSNGTIKNFSREPLRRASITLGVAYNSDLKKVREVLMSTIESDPKILKEPQPAIEIKGLAENSVDLNVYLWAERANYFAAVSDFYENTKAAFDAAGIEIPYPQRDLNIRQIESAPASKS
ncbi:MAG: mechanosensitive ion channel [Flavobacterium sp.]|nr:MAG: mechanosensitive ion channel [Flavobacterium sp.]